MIATVRRKATYLSRKTVQTKESGSTRQSTKTSLILTFCWMTAMKLDFPSATTDGAPLAQDPRTTSGAWRHWRETGGAGLPRIEVALAARDARRWQANLI